MDHSGSVYRHGFIDEDQNWTLTHGCEVEATSGVAEDSEAKVIICEGCFRSYSGSNICPECGKMHNPKSRYVETINGRLGLVDKKTKEVNKTVEYNSDYKENFYAELLGYAYVKHYSEGWAKWKYKSKFNTWPAFEDIKLRQPSKEIKNFITHLHIKERYTKKI